MRIIGGALFTLSFLFFCVFLGQLSELVSTMRKWESSWIENEWTHSEALRNAPINLMAIPKDLSEIYMYFWAWFIAAVGALLLLVF